MTITCISIWGGMDFRLGKYSGSREEVSFGMAVKEYLDCVAMIEVTTKVKKEIRF